jgi:hypothetical protein
VRPCAQRHAHGNDAESARCDAMYFDMLGLMKMARSGFKGPAKIPHVYRPGVSRDLGTVPVIVFSEEEIVPVPGAAGA